MEFGALVGDLSRYGDAQASSNVPAHRGELVNNPVALAAPLEVRVEVAGVGTGDGSTGVHARKEPIGVSTTSRRWFRGGRADQAAPV